jgi:hypothetical protein
VAPATRALEQPPDDAEREGRLELRGTRVEHLVAALRAARRRGLDQRRLADAGAALDHQQAAAVQQPSTAASSRSRSTSVCTAHGTGGV